MFLFLIFPTIHPIRIPINIRLKAGIIINNRLQQELQYLKHPSEQIHVKGIEEI